jgi:uncharacterized small protein (DUF1192 family)
MSGIFGKLKQGAQDAGKKAQMQVEITRLKSQIANKESEIKSTQFLIGELVYDSYEKDNFTENEQKIFNLCKTIVSVKVSIAQLEQRIHELRDEKTCPSCNATATLATKFCSQCGNSF